MPKMNIIMKDFCAQLMNLPDEILLMIFKKADRVEILNSMVGINKRIDQILCDPTITGRLTLMRSSASGRIHPLDNVILDRFCCQTLPQIHHHIQWLNLESLTMERILRAAEYPNLCGLGLHRIDYKAMRRLFDNDTDFVRKFKSKISKLAMSIYSDDDDRLQEMMIILFTRVLTVFKNLIYLNMQGSLWFYLDAFRSLSGLVNFSSSTLLELHVQVANFSDCLFLLDGRFNRLRSFHVKISVIVNQQLTIDNKVNYFVTTNIYKKLVNLKHFSMILNSGTNGYYEYILPLLYRMSNLETLTLDLVLDMKTAFIDGNRLKTDIIDRFPSLKKFFFYIYSFIKIGNRTNPPSNEDIMRTFVDFNDYEITSCVDYFPTKKKSQCLIYTHPYRKTHYYRITNNFPGGLFKCVEKISLFDERPFEHEFFIRLAKSFPLLRRLELSNMTPQNNKKSQEANNDNRRFESIEYPHMTELSLVSIHDDYLEQFLDHTKACLANNIKLYIFYENLQTGTRNFTNDATRINCGRLEYLYLFNVRNYSKPCSAYFPNLKAVYY
ncbi:unnamed protein product [Rotaria magnacalcarata]|uniref:F-box domain-containing protein n=3 Tax=Rotaria magnacalcarata TaxID=392030 RepID=A0A816LY14_9BILA|nr:unnamed protein product [Rotaria magnacalcarata]CAF2227861.1 unnamed protein product [Rotaria magnacalcarata]CAF4241918.1 unnamed protein product [Rotaria magnacalcarata]